MKKYDLITPEGTRDLLFDECVARRTIEERLRNIFVNFGYSEVVTPGIEFYDVFNSKKRYVAQEFMYKLSDTKGRLMVIRPDTTLPIARLVATRLREETFPLKLFYNQNIFRVNPKNNGRDDEIVQSGIEIIGGDVERSDLEVLSMAVDVLKSCDVDDFRLEIGNSAFFKNLISCIPVSEDESEEIRTAIENKNFPELSRLLSDYSDFKAARALKELPELFGGAEIFEKAEKAFENVEEVQAPLNYLKYVFDCLCKLGISERVSVDLGLVNKATYYTGILFRGYIEGYGMSVISGGRYDTLIGDFGVNIPATGFAVNINATANVLLKKTEKPLLKKADVLVFAKSVNFINSLLHCKKLIGEGFIVDNSVLSSEIEAVDYARKNGIRQIDIVEDENEVRTILIGGKRDD